MKKRLKVLTWHVHGSYLYYLSQMNHDLYLPCDASGRFGYGGRTKSYPWPANVIEIPAHAVPDQQFDCILYQAHEHYREDRWTLLSERQRSLPQIFLEHDPPREHPTDTKHPVDDPHMLLIHVTHFNRLMWDNGATPSRVIEHGVLLADAASYSGKLARGVVVVNHINRRGRRLGADLYEQTRREIPLDLIGMGWEEAHGHGEISHQQLPIFIAPYRFFYNPIRYTSLGLAICEAMMVGLPIVGLATTELASIIQNGVSGYVDTCHDKLLEAMHRLLQDPTHARRLSAGARELARERFAINRFVRDWDEVIDGVCSHL